LPEQETDNYKENVLNAKQPLWIILAFALGALLSPLSSLVSPPRSEAQAQPAAVKYEYKFFDSSINAGLGKLEKDLNDGGWEYTGYSAGTNIQNSGRDVPLFKRPVR
jgi:hypothetical protein